MRQLMTFLLILFLFSCTNKNIEQGGKLIKYYTNGEPMISVDTLNRKFNGILTYYANDGKLIAKQNWKNGLPFGDFIFYDESGNEKFHQVYTKEGYKTIIGNDIDYNIYYDINLVKFYRDNLTIIPDTIFSQSTFLKMTNYRFEIFNVPKIMKASINYGMICREDSNWRFKIGPDNRTVSVKFWVDLYNRQIMFIDKEIN